jgi:hypothetical protein
VISGPRSGAGGSKSSAPTATWTLYRKVLAFIAMSRAAGAGADSIALHFTRCAALARRAILDHVHLSLGAEASGPRVPMIRCSRSREPVQQKFRCLATAMQARRDRTGRRGAIPRVSSSSIPAKPPLTNFPPLPLPQTTTLPSHLTSLKSFMTIKPPARFSLPNNHPLLLCTPKSHLTPRPRTGTCYSTKCRPWPRTLPNCASSNGRALAR